MTVASERVPAVARPAQDARPSGALNPISLWVSLLRNPLRTVPMMAVTLAASLGIAAVVVLADSLIRTSLAPNDFLLSGLVVRADGPTLDRVDGYVRQQAHSAVSTRIGPPTFIKGRIFQLDSYFLVLTVDDGSAGPLIARYGDHLQRPSRGESPSETRSAAPATTPRCR